MESTFQGITVALTTPFERNRTSPERLRENILRYNQTGLAGYLVLGSTGECVSLSDDESEALVREARKSAGSGKAVIAGTARESTDLTVDFTNRLAGLGIDAALVRPPSYFKSRLTKEALRAHYLSLADRVKVPVIVYNIPQNTGISLDSGLIAELAGHPNIAGLKDSSGNIAMLGELVPKIPPGFSYLLGSGSVFFPGLEMGASGAILAVAGAAPELCVDIYDLWRRGKKEEARRLQLRLIPLNKAVTEKYGIAGLKHALDLLGFYGGPVRLPLLPLEEKGKEEIAAVLGGLGLIPS